MNTKAIITACVLFPVLALQAQKLLTPEKISNLVPGKIDGFHLKENSKSKQVKVGTLTYVICERTFVRKDQSVQILLFDYLEAPVMYDQAIGKWGEMQPVDSDSALFATLEPGTYDHAWQSFQTSARHAQLVLGIHSRFFLTMSAHGMDLPELKRILKLFEFEKFPKAE